MKITLLYENKTTDDVLACGHGLSLYIEGAGHRILFDAGPDADFAENAKKLGIALADVDMMVLSHGHYDHGGGLAAFLAANKTAPVYMGEGAFFGCQALHGDNLVYIGLDKSLADNGQIVFTKGARRPHEGILLFTLPQHTPRRYMAETNNVLYITEDGARVQDRFLHEQSLVICESGRRVLVCGCAHSGVVNLVAEAEKLCGGVMDVVLGGFHLGNPTTGQAESDELIDAIAAELGKRPTQYYTFHCTGDVALARLQAALGKQVQTLATGDVLSV